MRNMHVRKQCAESSENKKRKKRLKVNIYRLTFFSPYYIIKYDKFIYSAIALRFCGLPFIYLFDFTVKTYAKL